MTIYLTADWHLGHYNIIHYCGRPFSSSDEMDAHIIDNANQIVGPEGELYHLGDFSLQGTNNVIMYIKRLCIKRLYLIPGSHDVGWFGKKGQKAAYIEQETQGKAKVLPPLYTLKKDGKKIVMCHYAMRTWDGSHHGSYHVYGHSHGNLPAYGRSFDVGVDAWGFKPLSLEKIIEIAEKKEKQNVQEGKSL